MGKIETNSGLQWGPALIAGKGRKIVMAVLPVDRVALQWGPALIAGKGGARSQ